MVLDNLSSGSADNLAWAGSDVDFVHGDVTDPELARKVIQGCDWVFHHAAVVSVVESVQSPEFSNQVNIDATLSLLAAARDAGVKRFIFASSAAVYGDGRDALKTESLPVQPVSPYGLQKYVGERYCQLFWMLYGLPAVALRYFNVFGTRQSFSSPYSGVIARFCSQLLAGETPVVFGDGLQTRDFVSVNDVVRANLLAAEAPVEKTAGKVFNCASGHSVTLLKLLQTLAQILGQSVQPGHHPARAGDIRHSAASIDLIKRCLGYMPSTSLQEGLAETLEFYRSFST